MDSVFTETTKGLLSFIKRSPTAYQAVDTIAAMLESYGAVRLYEASPKLPEKGGTYFITRNGSSLIAFTIPCEDVTGFMIAASHTDSPTFKIKPNFDSISLGKYKLLNTEKYGGMIMSSWLDRPLSVAGRIAVRSDRGIMLRNVVINRDLLVIPNVCIHFNRSVNDGYKFDPKSDTLPLYSGSTDAMDLLSVVAEAAEVSREDIISHDLYLYNRSEPSIWGADNEFFSSPRIDNLECAYATLLGFLGAEKGSSIRIYAAFDNEEVGSSTKQGAASSFLSDVIDLICRAISVDPEEKKCLLASSLMLSADNAHARHPNHPEYTDNMNCPDMNSGIVVKTNANQRYTTDAVSSALFTEICRSAGVPFNFFANRSDIAGGSTLGNISNTKVALNTVDIGLAQLAMHSSYETAGVMDAEYLVRASREFYSSSILTTDDKQYSIIR